VKGKGCDCKGLVSGVAREIGHADVADADYGVKVDAGRLQMGLAAVLDKVSEVHAGDVLLLRLGNVPQHLAICTVAESGKANRMVHCHPGIGKVLEVPVGTMFQESIVSVWRWRNLCR